jgi:hypothetical protein
MSTPTAKAEAERETEPIEPWTQEGVCRLFTKALGSITVLSVAGRIQPAGSIRPGKEKVVNWLYRYLDEDDRNFMFRFCAQQHRRRNKLSDVSDTEFLAQFGYPKLSGARKRRLRICKLVAACLSRDGIRPFSI